MENTTPKKVTYSVKTRIIAGTVAAALLLGIVANAAVRVRIEPGEKTEAATNYLVDSTGYVNQESAGRMWEKLLTTLKPATLEDHYRMASTQIAEEDYAGALESIEACIGLDDGLDPALTQDILMKKGCLLVLLENYEDAIVVLDQVTEGDPHSSDAWLVKAQIYAQLQELEPLAEMLENYLNLIPGDNQIRLVLAQTYFSLEQFKKAEEAYQLLVNAEDLSDQMPQIHYLYALTQIQLEDFEKAEKSLRTLRTENPEFEDLCYYLGVCLMSREAYDEAATEFSAALEQESMVQLSYYSRGVCGLMIPEYDVILAVEDLQNAVDYKEENADPTVAQQAQDLLDQLMALTEGMMLETEGSQKEE